MLLLNKWSPGDLDTRIIRTEVFYQNSAGEWFQAKIFDQNIECRVYLIRAFKRFNESFGTEFAIKLINRKRFCAFILTAAHIFSSNFSFEIEKLDFWIGNEVYDKKLDWNDLNSFLSNPISLNQLFCFDDWCICELTTKRTNL